MSPNQDYIKTKMGFWTIKAGHSSINSIGFSKQKPALEIKRNVLTDSVIRQLRAYFDGLQLNFEVPLNMDNATDFQRKVWNELLKIPYGKTISYKKLAFNLGNPKSIRAAASANGKNPFPIIVPCHRVIGTNGHLTGYAHGLELKSQLLELEGVIQEKQLSLF